MTDREAAERHGISRQSISNYRRRVKPESDDFSPELLRLFTLRLQEAREADDWAEELTDTIRQAMSFIREAVNELDPAEGRNLDKVSSALSVLMEANLAKSVIDAKLAEQGERDRTTGGQESAGFGSIQAQA